jgi:hypothetical protein
MGESDKVRSWRLRRIPPASPRAWPHAVLAAAILAAHAAVAATVPDTAKAIFVLPALQWNSAGEAWSYATEQNPIELARTMSGLSFGMTPEEASGHLRGATHVLHWSDLPRASEFTDDVRYMWIPIQAAGALRARITSCTGDDSYIVILFLNNALFRASWRFLPSPNCPDPRAAAEDVYAGFVPLASTIAISLLYRTGDADVVDITDPAAGPLIATRWRMRAQ